MLADIARDVARADLPFGYEHDHGLHQVAQLAYVPRPIGVHQELEFIFRSLVELKLQVEELRRRLEERPQRVEVIEVGGGPGPVLGLVEADASTAPALEGQVVYRPGMSMAEVERAAIEAALKETRGNRRQAAEILGIGERTLYRKLKEYALV